MRLALHGGFGEKGRTSLGVDARGGRVLLDAGVMTSARGTPDYWPAIPPEALRALDAIVVTHAHEDHAGALGWCLANGFAGRILMSGAARAGCEDIVAAYDSPDAARKLRAARIEELPVGADAAEVGALRLSTGRSGHISGGLWCLVDDGSTRLLYCGDVVPASPVFAMDPLPDGDALILDASYGDDATSAPARAAEIAGWVRAHPQGSILPTPLFGRSLELFALLREHLALAPGMREALAAQIDAAEWLARGVADRLRSALARTPSCGTNEPLPRAAILCDDGMGMSGPSRELLEVAARNGHPVLLTGHVPDASPAHRLLESGAAQWIRLPTHPTLAQNLAIAAASRARLVLGHSCERDALARLARHLPRLDADAMTGAVLELD
ncbi:MAG: MBL fold metallo-hydrolase [Burkholderiales bacterium]|nr:MBL fold metallo-hydrolase [Burkholderiales bacterium]MCE7876443.1 MBL fold metallo-hydrolase [Betaproteobacteria bacterium PRO3]